MDEKTAGRQQLDGHLFALPLQKKLQENQGKPVVLIWFWSLGSVIIIIIFPLN